MMKTVRIYDVLELIHRQKQIEHAHVNTLYIEMHVEMVKDLLLDPDIETFIGTQSWYTEDALSKFFGARIFTHTDNNKRNMITVAYKADILIGENNDN